jgi:hypothetical protein
MPKGKSRILLISFNVAGHDSLALGYIKAFALKDATVSRRTEIETSPDRLLLLLLEYEHYLRVGPIC